MCDFSCTKSLVCLVLLRVYMSVEPNGDYTRTNGDESSGTQMSQIAVLLLKHPKTPLACAFPTFISF